MKDRDDHPAAALRLRALTVNWLLDFAEIDDLPVIAPDADMGALDRARYERRLGLVSGALSVGRFIHDFADLGAADVGERLLDEAYLGAIVRSPQPETPTDDPEEATDSSNEPEARFQRLLEAIGLEAGEVLVLSGSPDVSGTAAPQFALRSGDHRAGPGGAQGFRAVDAADQELRQAPWPDDDYHTVIQRLRHP